MVQIIMTRQLLLTAVIKVSNHLAVLAVGGVGESEASSGESWGEFRGEGWRETSRWLRCCIFDPPKSPLKRGTLRGLYLKREKTRR